MLQPKIRCLAVYRVLLTSELIEEGMELKYGGMELSASERSRAQRRLIEELTSVVLIELLIINPDNRFDLNDFHQPGSDQAVYGEVYLSEDGQYGVPSLSFEAPNRGVIRVAFFLHYYEPNQPLKTSYGEIALPPIQEIPEYLQKLIPYHPVD